MLQAAEESLGEFPQMCWRRDLDRLCELNNFYLQPMFRALPFQLAGVRRQESLANKRAFWREHRL